MEQRVFVVGSLNMDLLQTVERIPKEGETLGGGEIRFSQGGKGANQARAAGRLGAAVTMVGKTGDDAFGRMLREALEADGVDLSGVRVSTRATGTAIVLLLPDGENSIVIAPGANGDLTPEDALAGLRSLQRGDVLLCQLEVPLETVHAALQFARDCGATTILDPAPARPLSAELLALVDILTPNETEAALLDLENAGTVVKKLGAAGCELIRNGSSHRIAGFPIEHVVDTTGAGDTFNAALAVEFSRGDGWERTDEALRFANAAGALSVTKIGAGEAAPTRAELQAFLQRFPALRP